MTTAAEPRPRRAGRGRSAAPERRPGPGSRAASQALAVAIALAVASVLWQTRGTTLFADELTLFVDLAGGLDADAILAPRDGHLIAIPALLYDACLTAFGPDSLPLRILAAAVLAALAVVLYGYARRRMGPWLALAPVLLVLFLGAAWEALLWPYAMLSVGLALTAGIGALLLVERGGRGGDLGACALLLLAVASHSLGLAFCLGVAVRLLWRSRNRRRAWVFVVPLVLYAAWWLWALKFDSTSALDAGQIWFVPAFAAEALAVVLAALAGLAATISGSGASPLEIDAGWGPPLALAAIAAFALRLARGRVPIPLVATLTMLAAYWTFAALSLGPGSGPDESRYILPGAVLVILVAADAVAGFKPPSAARIAVVAITVLGVATGIGQLDEGGAYLRDHSDRARATATGIEAAEASAPEGFVPSEDESLQQRVPEGLELEASSYLQAADELGSIAFSEDELADQPKEIREVAERVRVAAISAAAGVDSPLEP
jgi:hypothetical protein